MHSNLKKSLILITLMGTISSQGFSVMASEGEKQLGELGQGMGIETLLSEVSEEVIADIQLAKDNKGEYSDMAFTNVTSFLYVRSEPTKDSEYVGKLYPGSAMKITGTVDEWTPVETGEITGYVKTEYIICGEEAESIAQQMADNGEEFVYAESRQQEEQRLQAEEEARAAQMENMGQEVVDYACQFIGNPYVWGGTSLTNGADCSGFVQSVFTSV